MASPLNLLALKASCLSLLVIKLCYINKTVIFKSARFVVSMSNKSNFAEPLYNLLSMT